MTMKPDWEFLLDESALATVLPRDYSHFARPIRDGLALFLGELQPEEQQAVLDAQAELPADASISERLGTLARCSPVLHKLGQVLARDQRMPRRLRQQLCMLESLPPTIPLEVLQQILAEELGSLETRGVRLVPPAIAEASVAVVTPFEDADGQAGVFKILKPGIEERLERELGLLGKVGEYLDQRCDELRIPQLDYEQAFQKVRDKLRDEVHLENEQRHLVEAKRFFSDEPRVHIPALFGHCTSRVTAMERIYGNKVTDNRPGSGGQRRRLASLVANALIAHPIFSKCELALFHSDPHAGNLFLTNDDRLGILDWSLVGTLDETQRIAIVQIILGAITLDRRRIVAVLERLADRDRLDCSALGDVVARWLRRVRHGELPGVTWLTGMLDDATQNAGLRVATDLMMFRKALHTVEGVVAEVGESVGMIDRVVIREFVRHFALEWPGRWMQAPMSRDSATRISNADIARVLWSSPVTAARFWMDHSIDVLSSCE